jgi:hypothetical protein
MQLTGNSCQSDKRGSVFEAAAVNERAANAQLLSL